MRYQGKITNWKDDQGFGFVIPNGGGKKAFVHIKAFTTRTRRPIDDDLISYEVSTDNKGRLQAKTIQFSDEKATSSKSCRDSSLGIIFTFIFCLFIVLAVLIGRLPLAILGLYFVASILTFLAYLIDKSAAKNNRWRIAESTLHLLGVIGGWPGALHAQKRLHHKTKKSEFQIIFWITVIINCSALIWLCTKNSTSFLEAYLRM